MFCEKPVRNSEITIESMTVIITHEIYGESNEENDRTDLNNNEVRSTADADAIEISSEEVSDNEVISTNNVQQNNNTENENELEDNIDEEQNTAEENAVSSEDVSSEDNETSVEPVIPRTRCGRVIKKPTSIYPYVGEQSTINVNAPAEKQLVGAGISGGFENTAELKVLKFDQAVNSKDKEKWA